MAGAIRSAVSSCSHVCPIGAGQGDGDPTRARRAAAEAGAFWRPGPSKVQEILASPSIAELWEPYPFNAGYFMCLKLKGIDAETLRQHLLDKYGVGVIADGERDIRVAFSSVDMGQLEDLYTVLATGARELLNQKPAGK